MDEHLRRLQEQALRRLEFDQHALASEPVETGGAMSSRCTDVANGDRLIAHHGEEISYVEGVGWHVWDDRRWSAQSGRDQVFERAKGVAAGIGAEEASSLDRRRLQHWCVQSQSLSRLNAMIECARTRLRRSIEEFNVDPYSIGVANGVVRFRKGSKQLWSVQLDEARPGDFITRLSPVPYTPGAQAPQWSQHMARAFRDPSTRAFVQELLGYTMLGVTSEQAIYVLYGRGCDGKSTTVNVVAEVLGDYAAAMNANLLIQLQRIRSADEPSPALASLAGDVRFAYAAEPPPNGRLDEGLIKLITGSSRLTARAAHGQLFEFKPRFKIVLECNALPRFYGSDDGIKRRLVVIPFEQQIREEDRVRDFDAILVRDEGEGILAWLVQGALRYLNRGQRLQLPTQVAEVTRRYREGDAACRPATAPSPSFAKWLASRVERNANHVEEFAVLWRDYRAFTGAREL